MEHPGALLCACTCVDRQATPNAEHRHSLEARCWWGDEARLCTESAHARVQVAKALQYLHEANPQLLHRDLKSENLLLTERGRTGDIRVMDFGLTKLRSAWPPLLDRDSAHVPNPAQSAAAPAFSLVHAVRYLPQAASTLLAKLGCSQHAVFSCYAHRTASVALTPVGSMRAEVAAVGRKKAEEDTSYVMTGCTGSYIYMAPEVVRSEQYGEKVRP